MIAKKITYNVLVSSTTKVLSIGIALYGIRLLAQYLGPEGFGKYTITLAFFAAFNAIADMGLHPIVTRKISRKISNESEVFSKVFTLRIIISALIFLLTSTSVWFLPYELDVKVGILIAAAAFIFGSSYGLLNSIFQKNLAMDKVALAEFIGKVIQMSIIVSLVKLELSFIYSIIAILMAMISNFTIIFLFSRSYIKIKLDFDFNFWKSFLRESIPMGISAVAVFLYFKIDTILLSFFQGSFEVGIYGTAYKIIETMIFFPAMVVGLVYPLFSKYIFSEKKKFLTIANTTIKFFALICVPLVVLVQFFAKDIIYIIGGDAYALSVPLLKVLIFALASIFFGNIFTSILLAANLQKKLMTILLIAATGNIVLNVIFIPIYSYTGAAFVSVATEIFVALLALKIAIKETPLKLKLNFLLFVGSASVLMYVIFSLLNFNKYINTLLVICIYVIFILITKVVSMKDLKSLLNKD